MWAAESGNPGKFQEGTLGAQETDIMLPSERGPERLKEGGGKRWIERTQMNASVHSFLSEAELRHGSLELP